MRNSAKLLISSVIAVSAVLGASFATAADLPARVYTKAPIIMDPGYNWTGFYLGGNLGYSWGRSRDDSTLTNGAGTVLFASSGTTNLNGVVGGGQAGYNWQMQSWVWGFEADIQGSGERGSRDFLCDTSVCRPNIVGGALLLGPAVPVNLAQSIDWFGTARVRGGFLVAPKVLLYGTGGLAYGGVKSSEIINTVGGFSNTTVKAGYTVGVGIEGVVAPNWTAKLEYLYVDLGRVSGSFVTALGAVGGGFLSSNYNSRITDNVLRVGLNYKWGNAIVAKY